MEIPSESATDWYASAVGLKRRTVSTENEPSKNVVRPAFVSCCWTAAGAEFVRVTSLSPASRIV